MLFKNTVVFLNGGTRGQCLVRGGLMSHGCNVMARCCTKVCFPLSMVVQGSNALCEVA